MKFSILFILYSFSYSEQKPLDENKPDVSTDTVASVIPIELHPDSNNSATTEPIRKSVQVFATTENVNSDKSNILKIPRLKKPETVADLNSSTSPTVLESVQKEVYNYSIVTETTSEKTEESSKKPSTSVTSTINAPFLDNSTSSIHAATDFEVTEPSNVGLNSEHSLAVSTLPTDPLTVEVVEIQKELSDLEILVIPLAGEDPFNNSSDSTSAPDATDIEHQIPDVVSTPPDSSEEIAEIVFSSVFEDDDVTPGNIPSNIQDKELSSPINLGNESATTELEKESGNHTSSETSEIMLAEETLFETTPKSLIDEKITGKPEILIKNRKSAEEFDTKKKNSSSATTTTNASSSVNVTQDLVTLKRTNDSLEESTDASVRVNSTAENNSGTSTTESSSLEKEIITAESFIHDLLDPAIVLAKRSLPNLGAIENPLSVKTRRDIKIDNQSR